MQHYKISPESLQFANLPIVDDVMEERRPNTHENGRDMAIALVPIFPTCAESNNSEHNKSI